jgi:hypothetical protein
MVELANFIAAVCPRLRPFMVDEPGCGSQMGPSMTAYCTLTAHDLRPSYMESDPLVKWRAAHKTRAMEAARAAAVTAGQHERVATVHAGPAIRGSQRDILHNSSGIFIAFYRESLRNGVPGNDE